MYNSTKEYLKRCIKKMLDQCDVTIDDIQLCLNELKNENQN